MKNRTGLQAIPHDVQGVEGEKNVAAPRHKVSARKIKKKLKNTETLGGGARGLLIIRRFSLFVGVTQHPVREKDDCTRQVHKFILCLLQTDL